MCYYHSIHGNTWLPEVHSYLTKQEILILIYYLHVKYSLKLATEVLIYTHSIYWYCIDLITRQNLKILNVAINFCWIPKVSQALFSEDLSNAMRDDYVVLTANKFTLEHLQLSEIFIYICIWIWVYWWNAKFLEKLLGTYRIKQ